MRIVFLDTGPLGLVSNPKATPENDGCRLWLRRLLASGVEIVIPEIADYEVRRELLRARRQKGIERLDRLGQVVGITYLPIDTEAIRLAASLWASVRQDGMPTADIHALDGDVILAGQAMIYAAASDDLVVATTNVRHISRFVHADSWEAITVG